MKTSKTLGLVFSFLFTFTSVLASEVYQVISAHPHDIKSFTPYIKTIKKDGRLWLVHLNENTPHHLKKFFKSTQGRVLKTYFPESMSKRRDARIKNALEQIDTASIKKDVEHLSNYRTRRAGTRDNQEATTWIRKTLEDLGYSVSEICYRDKACSVVADKMGSRKKDEVIMIMGHFDSVGLDFAGADDNASGTAVLLEIARVLKNYSNQKTIRFFVTNGEELGLLGAKHYARHLISTGKIKHLSLAINMDMVGYNSNGIVELETDSKFETLAKWFAELTATYTGLKSKITLGAWGSDHVPFIEANVPTLLTIENWNTKTPCYHRACDKPETLNYSYAAEIGKLNLAAIMTTDLL